MHHPIFSEWRSEIEVELTAAKVELIAATDELHRATEAARTAAIERRAVTEPIERLGRKGPLSSALAMRHRHRLDELRGPEADLVKARQGVATAHLHIEDLAQALTQINEIAPPPEPAATDAELAEAAA